jgi:hypothetical protein
MVKKNSSNGTKKVGNTRQPSPAKHWCFTYNNYTDLEAFHTFCSNSSKIDSFVFQEETGESGTPHLQGYICFITKTRPNSIFKIEYPTIHWETARNIKHSIAYCQKEETRTGKIFNKKIPIIRPLKLIKTLRPWQIEVVNIIKTEPDDRTIYWYWDNIGNKGKSALTKYLVVEHNSIILSGKGADMKYGLVKYIEKHGFAPTSVIIDIPRSRLDYVSYTSRS